MALLCISKYILAFFSDSCSLLDYDFTALQDSFLQVFLACLVNKNQLILFLGKISLNHDTTHKHFFFHYGNHQVVTALSISANQLEINKIHLSCGWHWMVVVLFFLYIMRLTNRHQTSEFIHANNHHVE